MDLERARRQDVENCVYEVLERTKGAQTCLNAAVTFVDPKEQLKKLEAIGADAVIYDIPAVLKSDVNTRGIRATASPRILDNYIPVYNAHITDKLQAVGAVIVAKASMDELSMGGANRNAYIGSVNNAWDESRISGGSNSGSTVLIAAGVIPFAIGTDTSDSMRKSAAYRGIIDMKPTYRRTSRYGIIPYAPSLDHAGYFIMSVQDIAVVLEVLVGRDGRNITSSNRTVEAYAVSLNHDLHGKRIAVLDNVQEAVANSAIRENFDVPMEELEVRGAIVIYVRMNDKLVKALIPTYYIITSAKATANHSNPDGIRFSMHEARENTEDVMISTRTEDFCSYVRKRFIIGSYSLFVENQDKVLREVQKVRRLIVEELNRVFASSDVVIASAAGTIAPLAEESKGSHLGTDNNVVENHMVLGSFAGYPSMAMPTGFVEGTSIGISMTVKTSDEQTLFSIRLMIKEETGLEGNDVEVDA